LGQAVLSGRESFVALTSCGRGMLLETLRTAEKVKKGAPYFAEIEDGPIDEDQLALARQLIERKTAPFDPAKFVDHYEAALRELIEAKAKGRRIKIDRGPVAKGGGQVIDLMAALKKSLSEDRPARGPAEVRDHPARTAGAKAAAGGTRKAAAGKAGRAKPAAHSREPAGKGKSAPIRQPARGRKSA
jgi:DNA end-binding protein Ku